MSDFRPLLGTLSLALIAGCAGPPADGGDGDGATGMPSAGLLTADADGWYSGQTLDGATRVRWRSESGGTPANVLFSLELELLDGAQPVTGAQVGVSAFMPDHGHGMNYVPQTTELGAGLYRVDGMLLHMPGFWQLHVDVVRDGLASRATFDLNL